MKCILQFVYPFWTFRITFYLPNTEILRLLDGKGNYRIITVTDSVWEIKVILQSNSTQFFRTLFDKDPKA